MSYSGREIYFVGTEYLLSQLMAHYCTEKTGASCFIKPKLGNVPTVSDNGGSKRLILYACEIGNIQLEALMGDHGNLLLASDHLVLFNINKSSGIEHDALKLGVHGFLYQDDGLDTLIKMIQTVFSSELWVSRRLLTEYLINNGYKVPLINKDKLSLTRRELQILTSITLGHSNTMIADKFFISPHTVKTHIYHLFKKINVSSRTQAAKWASLHL